MENKEIYNKIYSEIPAYNDDNPEKYDFVDGFALSVNGKILDAGCGQGLHLKRIQALGVDVFGIEVSDVCCQKYLTNVPHECSDILTYSKKGIIYDGLICLDVLEHITPTEIDLNIEALARMSKRCFMGIANHSDVINDIELHLIQEGIEWWQEKLKIYFKDVFLVQSFDFGVPGNKEIFFFFECSNYSSADFAGKNNYLTIKQDRFYQLLNLKHELRLSQKKQAAELAQQVNDLSVLKVALEQQVSESNNQRKALEQRVNDLSSQRVIFEQQVSESNNQRKALEQRVNDLSSQRVIFEQQVSESNNQRKTLEQQVSILSGQRAAFEHQVNDLYNQLSYLYRHPHFYVYRFLKKLTRFFFLGQIKNLIKKMLELIKLQPTVQQKIFTTIYENNFWGEKESCSGVGSTFMQTEKLRKELPALFQNYAIKKVLDLPCGNFNWMKDINLDDISYMGADIVKKIIVENKKKFKARNRKFKVMDLMVSKLPAVDLLLCRDCLVHLSFSDIYRVLRNLKRSRIRYLLTTTFTERTVNLDFQMPDWRPLNLELSPFNFPKPLCIINEECTEMGGDFSDKSLALWEIDKLIINS